MLIFCCLCSVANNSDSDYYTGFAYYRLFSTYRKSQTNSSCSPPHRAMPLSGQANRCLNGNRPCRQGLGPYRNTPPIERMIYPHIPHISYYATTWIGTVLPVQGLVTPLAVGLAVHRVSASIHSLCYSKDLFDCGDTAQYLSDSVVVKR